VKTSVIVVVRQREARMKRVLPLLAGVVAGLALPAAAADMVYNPRRPPELVAHLKGEPYWKLQAECAGLHSAARKWYADHGRDAEASAAASRGSRFLENALDRLEADRGVDRETAVDLIAPSFNAGLGRGETLLAQANPVDRGVSHFNLVRSACIEVEMAYDAQT
jgi:hypothetical protein